MRSVERFSAFDGSEIFIEGTLPEVNEAIRQRLAALPDSQVLVFSHTTGRQTDIYLDLPVTIAHLTASPTTSSGRTSLTYWQRSDVAATSWEWLNSQPGGASVALRKLVEMAMRENVDKDAIRQRHEAAYRL